MNINKLQTVIQDSLNKRELSHQTKILVKIIRYINQKPRGKEISSDMFVASIRALQKIDSTESIFLGEALIGEIESIAARRRLAGIYITFNQLERASKLISKLPNNDWKTKANERITSMKNINADIINNEKEESKFFTIIDPVKKPVYFDKITFACLFDRFTFDCLSKDVNLIPISKTNWKSVLNQPEVNYLLLNQFGQDMMEVIVCYVFI